MPAATRSGPGARLHTPAGVVSYGHGFTNWLSIGATLALNNRSEGHEGVAFEATRRIGLWAIWGADGRTGLQVEAGLGFGKTAASITRGEGLEKVMAASGAADITTTTGRIALAYGLAAGADWRVTPCVSLSRFETIRAAYDEAGSDFDASYGTLEASRMTATLDLKVERNVGYQGTISIGVGVAHDLEVNEGHLSGTSTIPGLDTFAITGRLERHRTRGMLSVGYTREFSDNRAFTGDVRIEQATFGDQADASLSVGYSLRF